MCFTTAMMSFMLYTAILDEYIKTDDVN